ncbi:hypothetical protein EMQU_0131 [Enterococcus mundtii QU 25]|uniref:Uncharacterized protein n=1 Tax=Enterococcus mundtii TaxID=53346 RepID=A0AAI8WDT7_ENTMU|nr:hypothetical protein EMQU_0131 [Enterococcus mundtii QU 25]BBM14874.1 uncharacterized protein EM151A_1682 [Enterococcus mundtii]GKS55561.1 hypothetical protein EMLAB_21760 [Enterococcus mundtii]
MNCDTANKNQGKILTIVFLHLFSEEGFPEFRSISITYCKANLENFFSEINQRMT